jgi:adhesin transport system outer membrane protein
MPALEENRLRVLLFGIVLMAAGALLAAPVPARADLLADELARLLRDHPQIRSREKAVEAAEHAIDKAKSGYLPEVTGSADTGVEEIDSPAERAKNRPNGDPWRRGRTTTNLTVTQNLYQGGATEASVDTAALNRDVAAATLAGTRQSTLLDGVSAYIDVLRQKRLIDLAFGNEENIQRQLNLEDERVQRGSGVTVDVLQAKSRLQLAKERRVTFEGALQDAVSKYTQVYNHGPDVDAMTEPAPPIKLLPETLDEALEIAARENPAVLNSQYTLDVAAARRRTIDSEYYPVLDLVGEFNYEKHNTAIVGTRRDYSILLQATWDLFTGFSTVAGAKQVAADYQAAIANHEFVTRRVQEQVKVAWQALVTTRERVELLENAVNIAAEVYSSRLKLREAGKETVINVLDAENEISNAQINYTSASYDLKVAVYRMLQTMGRLTGQNLGLPDKPPAFAAPAKESAPPARTLPEPLITPLIPPPARRPMPEPIAPPAGEEAAPPTGFWDTAPSDEGPAPALPGDLPTLPGEEPALPGDQPALPGDQPALPGDLPTLPGDQPTLPGELPTLPGEAAPAPEAPMLPGDLQPTPAPVPAPSVEPEEVPSLTPEIPPSEPPPEQLKIPEEEKPRIPFWEREDFGLTPYQR